MLFSDGRYVYRILYEEVDESEVELLHIVSTDERCGVDDYRYPRAGTPNAKCTLKVLEFQIEERGEVTEASTFHVIILAQYSIKNEKCTNEWGISSWVPLKVLEFQIKERGEAGYFAMHSLIQWGVWASLSDLNPQKSSLRAPKFGCE